LLRDLHPEFGYLGSFHLFGRKFGLVLVFIAFGVMAGMSGLAVFTADERPDPMKAMALAPSETMSLDSGPATTAPVDASVQFEPMQRPAATKTGRPLCEVSAAMDCAVPKPFKPRFVPAANERPAIAGVPIGRADPSPPVPVQVAPMPPSPAPVRVATAPDPPAPAAKKPRERVEQVERRERYREREQPIARENNRSYREREQPVARSNYGSPVWAGYARVY
jgi:hypothetical protein